MIAGPHGVERCQFMRTFAGKQSGRVMLRCLVFTATIKPNDELARFVTVLEIPPVKDAITAVRVQIVKDVKGAR